MKNVRQKSVVVVLLLVAWLYATHPVTAQSGSGLSSDAMSSAAQGDTLTETIDEWLAQMSAEEKVGQLFVVAFWGRNPSPPSRAGQLIQKHKIGGVVLITSNNNLVNGDADTPTEVAVLCNKLQGLAMGWDLTNIDGSTITAMSDEIGPEIPLLIAIDHEGDGFPYTRITGGTTPLPNPMAIGATWDTGYAQQVGEIVGRELAAMGINMLLGPVVDVLDDPRPGSKGDAGTRVFGGDPYWVGAMGRAYIHGVHSGSGSQVLTVAKHFPGHGGSDRLPDDEVATVDKSLQELERVELAPFFAVTAPDDQALAQTDALMSSHIRYRGFYGDIRQFTRPVSFDEQIMRAILDLTPLPAWRDEGVLISDSLGILAVRKYFDPQLQTFPHRQIARQALLAGNDLLVLSQFALTADWARQFENTVEVIEYFCEAYEHEPAFAARVDDAVRRILRLKLGLYPPSQLLEGRPDFSPEQVLVTADGLATIGQSAAVTDAIARRAVTVLHPTEDSLPRPPRRNEDILILAEERMIRECYETEPECDPHPIVPPSALQDTILRLYGPEGTNQMSPDQIHTRTFAQLQALLTWPSPGPSADSATSTSESDASGPEAGDLGQLLEQAEWIVFTMLDPNPGYPSSDALQLFLARNAHQIYDASVVVLAYTAPYYLDATEISKLTAYYVFYGKTQPFIETSARTLFGEVKPRGRSPVSIEGTYYDLGTQLSPSPDQQIMLSQVEPPTTSALAPFNLKVQTSVILDHNGNQVPDGTQVRFVAREELSGQIIDTVSSPTMGGIAQAALSIDRPGRIIAFASSGDAGEGPSLVVQALAEPTPTPVPTSLPPTRTPTRIPARTATRVPSPTAFSEPTATPVPLPTSRPAPPALAAVLDDWQGRRTDLAGVFLACLLVAGTGPVILRHTAGDRPPGKQMPVRARMALWGWVGGLVGYLTYGWESIPIARWLDWPTWFESGLVALIGATAFTVTCGILCSRRLARGSGPP